MAYKIDYTQTISSVDGISTTKTSYEAALKIGLSDVAAHSTTTNMIFTLDVSAVKVLTIVTDQDITIKTNSSGSPANTVAVEAAHSYIWTVDSLDAFAFTTDITSLYIVVAGATNANVTITGLVDPTP